MFWSGDSVGVGCGLGGLGCQCACFSFCEKKKYSAYCNGVANIMLCEVKKIYIFFLLFICVRIVQSGRHP